MQPAEKQAVSVSQAMTLTLTGFQKTGTRQRTEPELAGHHYVSGP